MKPGNCNGYEGAIIKDKEENPMVMKKEFSCHNDISYGFFGGFTNLV